jgi:hypothetical protein
MWLQLKLWHGHLINMEFLLVEEELLIDELDFGILILEQVLKHMTQVLKFVTLTSLRMSMKL